MSGTQIRRVGALGAWADAVGRRIADVTRPRAVVASTLFVDVRSSALAHGAQYHEAGLAGSV